MGQFATAGAEDVLVGAGETVVKRVCNWGGSVEGME
jgi:hypothetical protein